jgi:general secretion pathway protein D
VTSRPRLRLAALALCGAVALGAQAPTGTTLRFSDAPLADVVRALAQELGLTVVLGTVPDQRVTLRTAQPIPRAEVASVLETVLETHGLVLVPRGAVWQVVAASDAPAVGAVSTGPRLPDPPPLGLVSHLLALQSLRPEEALAALRPLAGPATRLEVVPRANALLITDRGAQVARYLDLLRTLDERPAGEAGLRTYVVPLKYADASELAATLAQLFGVTVSTVATGSLADRSLGSMLDTLQRRTGDAFRTRPPAPAVAAPPRADSGSLRGQTTIVAHGPSNALVIRTAPPNYPTLDEAIRALDVRPAQVLLEVTVAEVALGTGADYGVDWSAVRVRGATQTGVSLGDPISADSVGLRGLALRLLDLGDVDVRGILTALASRSDVRVLSTPQILAANNREARILVGQKFPFIAAQRLANDVALDRNVQYEDVGTNLTIIPTINGEDEVSVQVLQEVSTLTQQTVRAALDAPVISTREAATRAVIRDGQTVVIAGLIGETESVIDEGVPFLKDLPLLGVLFRRSSVVRNRSELVIFVTPRVIRTAEQADAARDRVQRQAPAVRPPERP